MRVRFFFASFSNHPTFNAHKSMTIGTLLTSTHTHFSEKEEKIIAGIIESVRSGGVRPYTHYHSFD